MLLHAHSFLCARAGCTQRLSCLFILLIGLACAVPVGAQSGSGTIQGTVRDATQAVMPGAKVAATHEATGVRFDTVTNEAGFFTLPALNIGTYEALTISGGEWVTSGSRTEGEHVYAASIAANHEHLKRIKCSWLHSKNYKIAFIRSCFF